VLQGELEGLALEPDTGLMPPPSCAQAPEVLMAWAIRACALAAVLAIALALWATSAQARTHRFTAAAVGRGGVVFRVRGIRPNSVVGLSIVIPADGRSPRRVIRHPIALRRARHQIGRGRLHVRIHVAQRRRVGPTRRRPRAVIRTLATSASAPGCPTTVAPGSWPVGCFRPYGVASPFNRPLPAEPRLVPNSAAIVNQLMSWGKAQGLIVGQPEGNNEDYGHPVYYSGPEDPLYRIHCTRWTSSCAIEGMQVRIPSSARPASGSDAHMVVIDQEGGWEYDFWQVHTQPLPPGGGTIEISHGGRTRWGTPGATGLDSNATAAGFGLEAGVIRAEEWASATAADAPINHALFMSVRCTAGFSVYPAAADSAGQTCPVSERADAPPLGAHFYLDMSEAEIDALPLPAWKKPILKAMASYGLYVGDTFGGTSNSFGLAAESDTQYLSLGLPGRYAELGKRWGVGTWNGAYVFDIASGVEWSRYLKVVEPFSEGLLRTLTGGGTL
jgi:hypothetical protein